MYKRMTLNYTELLAAYHRWCEVCDPLEISSTAAFKQYLQYSIPHNYTPEIEVDEEGYTKIQYLLGPHYKTIIRMWCAQHGVDTKGLEHV